MTQQTEREYIDAPTARATILGGISEPTEWRWRRDVPDFPKPTKVGARKFYKVAELRAFMERHAA